MVIIVPNMMEAENIDADRPFLFYARIYHFSRRIPHELRKEVDCIIGVEDVESTRHAIIVRTGRLFRQEDLDKQVTELAKKYGMLE